MEFSREEKDILCAMFNAYESILKTLDDNNSTIFIAFDEEELRQLREKIGFDN